MYTAPLTLSPASLRFTRPTPIALTADEQATVARFQRTWKNAEARMLQVPDNAPRSAHALAEHNELKALRDYADAGVYFGVVTGFEAAQ